MTAPRVLTKTANAALAAIVGVAFLLPIGWMAAASLKPEREIHRDVGSLRSFVPSPITLENYAHAARRGNAVHTLINTILVVSLIAAGGVLLNAPAAFAFARMRFPGRDTVFALLLLTIIIPLEIIVIPLFMTVRTFHGFADVLGQRGWTITALSVPFMAKAFNIFLLRQYFLSLPRAFEEAAFMDGAGWWTAYWRIALPNAKPAIVTVVLLDFVIHWNDFLWPLVICHGENTRTIQLVLGNLFTQPPISWGAILAYALVATVPMMVVFAVGQRGIVQSLATSGVRG